MVGEEKASGLVRLLAMPLPRIVGLRLTKPSVEHEACLTVAFELRSVFC